jgi:hypothetical protein
MNPSASSRRLFRPMTIRARSTVKPNEHWAPSSASRRQRRFEHRLARPGQRREHRDRYHENAIVLHGAATLRTLRIAPLRPPGHRALSAVSEMIARQVAATSLRTRSTMGEPFPQAASTEARVASYPAVVRARLMPQGHWAPTSSPPRCRKGHYLRRRRLQLLHSLREDMAARLEMDVQRYSSHRVWPAQVRYRVPGSSRPSRWKTAIQPSRVAGLVARTSV